MFRNLLILASLGLSAAVSSTFTIKDCAKDANRVLTVSGVSVSPTPLVIPGPLTISLNASLSKQLTSGNLIIEVSKNLGFFGFVKVPCLNDIGSCTYDGCEKAAKLGSYLQATDDSVFQQIYTMLKQNNINLFGCPIPAPQKGSVKAYSYNIPTPTKEFDWLVNGDYHIVARVQDKVSKVDYACLDINIGVMRKSA